MSSRGKEAAARHVYRVVLDALTSIERLGVGTGSTVGLVLDRLLGDKEARRLLRGVVVVASSLDTLVKLVEAGVRASLTLPPGGVDLYFDGADEVACDKKMCMLVKGRGAAMTREKMLAFYSTRTLIVVDESKVSKTLGEKGKPVPVEVHPDSMMAFIEYMRRVGVRAEARRGTGKDGPVVTDNGGVVVDTWPWGVMPPHMFEALLDTTPGVIGHGLFLGVVDEIVVGHDDGSVSVIPCRRTRIPRRR
ncbi:MAG: ribose 5-phosphate isomerase A [Crenarchaeota archaeon]|nr:ribose 5-phosphate isomerase A [Thermoproteota archaeon]